MVSSAQRFQEYALALSSPLSFKLIANRELLSKFNIAFEMVNVFTGYQPLFWQALEAKIVSNISFAIFSGGRFIAFCRSSFHTDVFFLPSFPIGGFVLSASQAHQIDYLPWPIAQTAYLGDVNTNSVGYAFRISMC